MPWYLDLWTRAQTGATADRWCARWGTRLSALRIRGNGAVVRAPHRAGGLEPAITPHVDFLGNPELHHLVPDGDCAS